MTSKIDPRYLSYNKAQVQALLDLVNNPDATPTEGSSSLITSGAVFEALGGVADITALLSDLVQSGALGYPEFDTATMYYIGNICFREGKLWKFNHAHKGSWDESHVDETSVEEIMSGIKAFEPIEAPLTWRPQTGRYTMPTRTYQLLQEAWAAERVPVLDLLYGELAPESDSSSSEGSSSESSGEPGAEPFSALDVMVLMTPANTGSADRFTGMAIVEKNKYLYVTVERYSSIVEVVEVPDSAALAFEENDDPASLFE